MRNQRCVSVILTLSGTIRYYFEPIQWYNFNVLSETGEHYEQIVELMATYLDNLFVAVGIKYTLLNRQSFIDGLWCLISLCIIQFESISFEKYI